MDKGGSFTDGFPIKNGGSFHGYVSHNQMVINLLSTLDLPNHFANLSQCRYDVMNSQVSGFQLCCRSTAPPRKSLKLATYQPGTRYIPYQVPKRAPATWHLAWHLALELTWPWLKIVIADCHLTLLWDSFSWAYEINVYWWAWSGVWSHQKAITCIVGVHMKMGCKYTIFNFMTF